MAEEWKLRSNCANYANWLEYELGSRRIAFGIVDNILYSKRYGGAHKLCAGCPVRQECLTEALGMVNQIGWWGDLTPRERRAHLRELSRAELPVPALAEALLESQQVLDQILAQSA